MSNVNGGTVVLNSWLRLINQVGLPTVAVCVLCFVVWKCTIVPFTEERAFLISALQESVKNSIETNDAVLAASEDNRDSLQTIADATKAMAANSARTRDSVEGLNEDIHKFCDRVSAEHATSQESLDSIEADTQTIILMTEEVKARVGS